MAAPRGRAHIHTAQWSPAPLVCPAGWLTCASSASSSSSYRLLYRRRFFTISRCRSADSRLGGRGRQQSWKKRSWGVL